VWNDRAGSLFCALVAISAILFALMSTDDYLVKVIVWIATNALLAACLRFVYLIGELNIATAAFFGIGAYTSAICTTMLGASLLLALVASVIVAGAISALFGYVTLRVKGPYFLLISFSFTEIVRLIYTQTNAIGGNSGMIGIFPPIWLDPYFPAIIVTTVALLLAGLYEIERRQLGKLFKAIQNNDDIPRSVGINVLGVKILCLVVASAAAGLGGALYAHSNNVISPGDFTFFVAVFALAYVKIGGEDHIVGAILGAALLTVLGQWMLGFGTQESIFYGSAIIVAMLVMPKGILGIVRSVRGLILRGRWANGENAGHWRAGGEKAS
jgi:branched-chain amino acid transport system permease protein